MTYLDGLAGFDLRGTHGNGWHSRGESVVRIGSKFVVKMQSAAVKRQVMKAAARNPFLPREHLTVKGRWMKRGGWRGPKFSLINL